MALPPILSERLTSQGVDFQILDNREIAPLHEVCSGNQIDKAQVVRGVVLQSGQQQVQLLLPGNCMVDPERLNALTEQDWQPSVESSAQYNPEETAQIPGLALKQLPLLIDKRLLQPPDLYLELSNSGQFLHVQQAEFAKLIEQGSVLECCTVLLPLQRPQNDREAVEDSVKKFTQLRIKRRLEETLEMPPLPETAERIIQLRIDPDAGAAELAKVVEQDASLAAQVVSWAASPYYAAPGAIKSVHDAVIRVLGFDLVINLALGLALGNNLKLPSNGPFGAQTYWRQSVISATLMESLVKAIPSDYRPAIGLAYLSGLLSNYGYLVLAHIFPPYFDKLNRDTFLNQHLDSYLIEQNHLGIDRETLASQLMECWSMPEEVIAALRWQNYPEFEGEHAVYAKLLYLCQQLLRNARLLPGPAHPIPESLFEFLHLDREDALHALNNIISKQDELLQIARTMSNG